ncbi:MAG: hypothetical protein PHW63_04905 [Alphaproteobacteria bacterium]|nr:hypothetical protein [Alphaproteobacteria bacterium]
MPDEAHFEEKKLLYRLCRFLISKKTTAAGKGISRPIEIKLKDFVPVLFSDTLLDDEIIMLKKELEGLAQETKDNDNPLFKCPDLGSKRNFIAKFRDNGKITLTYKRVELEEYFEKLKEGDAIREQGENYIKLLLEKINGIWTFKFKGKYMPLIQRTGSKDLILNICLWMFEKEATFTLFYDDSDHKVDISTAEGYEDYEIGDGVNLADLAQFLISGEILDEDRLTANDKHKPIRDAITGLNKRAKDIFEREIFRLANQEISVIR